MSTEVVEESNMVSLLTAVEEEVRSKGPTRVPFPKNLPSMQRAQAQERVNGQVAGFLNIARTSDDPNKALEAISYLAHALDMQGLIHRVPADFTPAKVDIQTPDISSLLSPMANLLSKASIQSTVHEYKDGNEFRVAACGFASKIAPVGTMKQIDETYIRRWANFLNDVAAKGIWQHGSMVSFGIIELAGFRNTPPRAAIFSFIFTRMIETPEGKFRNETPEEMNQLLNTDVFRMEGDVGSNDWSDSKFPW